MQKGAGGEESPLCGCLGSGRDQRQCRTLHFQWTVNPDPSLAASPARGWCWASNQGSTTDHLLAPRSPTGPLSCWLSGGWASRSAGAQPCPMAAGAGSAQWALATPHLAEDTSASAVTTGPPAGDRDALCPGPACPAPAGPLRPARVRHFWYGPWASPSPAPLADEVSRPGVPSRPPSGHRKPL